VAEAQDVQAPEGTAFGAGRAEVVRGAPAAVLTYVGDRVPVRLERVLVREQSAAWLVEVAYWSSAESAYGGLALRVAESIEVSPDPSGE
jgi:hypothetical protein